MQYESLWTSRCYSDGLPDEVPAFIDKENLAPSWKRIAIALLKNDLQMTALGYTPKKSDWYSVLKRIEINGSTCVQLRLF